VGEQAGL